MKTTGWAAALLVAALGVGCTKDANPKHDTTTTTGADVPRKSEPTTTGADVPPGKIDDTSGAPTTQPHDELGGGNEYTRDGGRMEPKNFDDNSGGR